MTLQYLPVLLLLLAATAMVALILFLDGRLGPRPRHAPAMARPFECGSPPLQADNRRRTGVRFYLVALLFVMFDLEAVLLYPWAVLHRQLGWFGLVELLVFVATLAVGLLWVWRRGALEWR